MIKILSLMSAMCVAASGSSALVLANNQNITSKNDDVIDIGSLKLTDNGTINVNEIVKKPNDEMDKAFIKIVFDLLIKNNIKYKEVLQKMSDAAVKDIGKDKPENLLINGFSDYPKEYEKINYSDIFFMGISKKFTGTTVLHNISLINNPDFPPGIVKGMEEMFTDNTLNANYKETDFTEDAIFKKIKNVFLQQFSQQIKENNLKPDYFKISENSLYSSTIAIECEPINSSKRFNLNINHNILNKTVVESSDLLTNRNSFSYRQTFIMNNIIQLSDKEKLGFDFSLDILGQNEEKKYNKLISDNNMNVAGDGSLQIKNLKDDFFTWNDDDGNTTVTASTQLEFSADGYLLLHLYIKIKNLNNTTNKEYGIKNIKLSNFKII